MTIILKFIRFNDAFYSFKLVSQSRQNPGTLNAIKAAFLDCFSTPTGHGLPQITKPDNLFFRVLWVVFFLIALVGGICFISQAVEQYLPYGVITTTKINRLTQMTLPALKICARINTKEMIISCYSKNGGL